MKKKRSPKIKSWAQDKSVLLLIAALTAVIFFGTVFCVAKIRQYNYAANQAAVDNIRELVLLAVRGLKKDAPVDPRTGDVYFPESRLYLSNPDMPLTLTYLLDKGDVTDSQGGLSVSTYPVRGTERIYEARNINELFSAIPNLQACSRGIKLVHHLYPESDTQNQLKHTVSLNNGQKLYVYVEKSCPQLNETADLFKSIQAY